MIDPKFNELPIDAEGDFEGATEGSLSEAGLAEGDSIPRRGLSINDTVAANANLSVGSRGVDTSGTSVGSGAGAGMTLTTAGDEDSPAPLIAPGARGSGTTLRGDTVSELSPATRLETDSDSESVLQSSPTTSSVSASTSDPLAHFSPTTRLEAGTESTGTSLLGTDEFSIEEISQRAYQRWIDRGSPHGSPEIDWQAAVEELRRQKQASMAASA